MSLADKTIKLWKISERDKRPEGYNLKEEDGRYKDPNTITSLRVSPSIKHIFRLNFVETVCLLKPPVFCFVFFPACPTSGASVNTNGPHGGSQSTAGVC